MVINCKTTTYSNFNKKHYVRFDEHDAHLFQEKFGNYVYSLYLCSKK